MKELTVDYSTFSEAEIKEYITGEQMSDKQIRQLLCSGKIPYILHTGYGIGILMSQNGEAITWIRT